MEIFFVLPIVAVLVFWGWRSMQKRRRKRTFDERMGHSPEQPWVVHRVSEFGPYVDEARCHCGGKPVRRSQTLLPDHREIHVVGCECLHCDEKIRLYFRVEYLN